MEILINLSNAATSGVLASGDRTWFEAGNEFTGNTGGPVAPISASLPDVDGVLTGISFFQTQGSSSTGTSGVAPPYPGDAEWAGRVGNTGNGGVTFWFSSGGVTRIFGFGNLDPAKKYRIEGFSSRADSGDSRPTTWAIGGQAETIESVDNASNTAIFTNLSPDANGQILISTTRAGNTSYTNALRLVEEAASGPTATLSGNLQPGASFTVTYSNYDAIPVSPVTITDSNNNAITVAVTINDAVADGKHSGTATGTFPALPSSGTAQGLLFGNVTVELNT